MKYLVMECNPGYAVLMDEESRVVRAANLHYAVGDTVTNPILMGDHAEKPQISRTVIKRLAAVAACFLILSTAGIGLYFRNRRTTESVVMLVERKRYEVALNPSGEVLQIQEENDEGKTVIESYEGQHVSLADALGAVLQDSLDQGNISEDAPVQIYLSAENKKAYDAYKAEIEQEAAKLQLKAEVQALEPPKPPVTPPEPPKEPPKDITPPEPGKATDVPEIAPPPPGNHENPPGVNPPEHETGPLPPEEKIGDPEADKPEPPEHEPAEPPAGPEEPVQPPEPPKPLPEPLKPDAEQPVLTEDAAPELPEPPEPAEPLQIDAVLPDALAAEPVPPIPLPDADA